MLQDSDSSKREYDGMTINERLFVAGLIDELDKAVREKRRNDMKKILMKIQLTEEEAEWSVEQILSEPQKYGF